MKLLLTGANGQLGRHMRPQLSAVGQLVTTARRGADLPCDLNDPDGLSTLLGRVQPDVIVNTAAWTAVDAAEHERNGAWRMNCDVPARLAEWCAQRGALLVHFSTDYVFSGDHHRAWREDDPTAPLNVYGASKRAGEEAILDTGCRALILRTSWVYSRLPGNFLSAILTRAQRGEALRVVNDQTGSPTWAGTLAEATVHALSGIDPTDPGGLFHLSSRGSCSWYELAREAVAMAVDCGRLPARVEVTGIRSDQWPQTARRPTWSVMDSSRFERRFDYRLPRVEDALRQCLQRSGPDPHDA